MPSIRRSLRRLCAAVVVVLFVPAAAAAQEKSLRIPTIAASTAAAADWASTYHALKYYKMREVNPVLRPLDHAPGPLVTVGALIDVGTVSAWNLTVGRKNPRVAAAGLWAMAAFRTYLVVHNLRNVKKSEPR